MSIDHLHHVCDQAAANLDDLLAELEPFSNRLPVSDAVELVLLAQACLEAAARIADETDATLSDGQAGLVQVTTATLRSEPAPDGLELDAIAQIITTVKAGQRVAS